MIRTRTIREAAAYFKETDPDTCLTETAIRTLLRTGRFPVLALEKNISWPLKPWRFTSPAAFPKIQKRRR